MLYNSSELFYLPCVWAFAILSKDMKCVDEHSDFNSFSKNIMLISRNAFFYKIRLTN